MLFMRWREMNGKKKHINVNEHIVAHKKNMIDKIISPL